MGTAVGHSSASGDNQDGLDPALARTLLPPLLLAWSLLTICLYTLTLQGKQWPRYLRVFLSPFVLWGFWDFGFGHYNHYNPLVPLQVSMYSCPAHAVLRFLVSGFKSYILFWRHILPMEFYEWCRPVSLRGTRLQSGYQFSRERSSHFLKTLWGASFML